LNSDPDCSAEYVADSAANPSPVPRRSLARISRHSDTEAIGLPATLSSIAARSGSSGRTHVSTTAAAGPGPAPSPVPTTTDVSVANRSTAASGGAGREVASSTMRRAASSTSWLASPSM
jgi:hypothetical protein